MKKKFLLFLLALLIMPISIMLVGCGGNNATKGLNSIQLQDGNLKGEYLQYTYTYGEDLDFIARDLKLIANYSDGTTAELTEEQYAQVTTEVGDGEGYVPFEMRSNQHLDVGWYRIRVGYSGMYAYINLEIMNANYPNNTATINFRNKDGSQISNTAMQYHSGRIEDTQVGENTWNQHFNSDYYMTVSVAGHGLVKQNEVEGIYYLTTAQKTEYDAISIEDPTTHEFDEAATKLAKQAYLQNIVEDVNTWQNLTYNNDVVAEEGQNAGTKFEVYTHNNNLVPSSGYYYAFAKVKLQNYNPYYTSPTTNTWFKIKKGVIDFQNFIFDDIEGRIGYAESQGYLTPEEEAENPTEEARQALREQKIAEAILAIDSNIDNTGMTAEEYKTALLASKMTTFNQIFEYMGLTAELDYSRQYGTSYENMQYLIGSQTLGTLNTLNNIFKFANYFNPNRFSLRYADSTLGLGAITGVGFIKFMNVYTSVDYTKNGYTYNIKFDFPDSDDYYKNLYEFTNNEATITLNVIKGQVAAPYTTETHYDEDLKQTVLTEAFTCEYNYGNAINFAANTIHGVTDTYYDFDALVQTNGNASASAVGDDYYVSYQLIDAVNYEFVCDDESHYYGVNDNGARRFNWAIVKRKINNASMSLTYNDTLLEEGRVIYDGTHDTFVVAISSVLNNVYDEQLQEYIENVAVDAGYFTQNRTFNYSIEDYSGVNVSLNPSSHGLTNTITINSFSDYDDAWIVIRVQSAADDNFEEFNVVLNTTIYIEPYHWTVAEMATLCDEESGEIPAQFDAEDRYYHMAGNLTINEVKTKDGDDDVYTYYIAKAMPTSAIAGTWHLIGKVGGAQTYDFTNATAYDTTYGYMILSDSTAHSTIEMEIDWEIWFIPNDSLCAPVKIVTGSWSDITVNHYPTNP